MLRALRTPLDRRGAAEGLGDRLQQCLAIIDDEEARPNFLIEGVVPVAAVQRIGASAGLTSHDLCAGPSVHDHVCSRLNPSITRYGNPQYAGSPGIHS